MAKSEQQAGRVAGYTAHCEQVIPELAQVTTSSEGDVKIVDARIDVELFGHPYAADHLLDGTIKHLGCATHVQGASKTIGYIADEGTNVKAKRYPARRGKVVLACAMETWGRTTVGFDALLDDLAMLASRRQRERGIYPTKWKVKWQTQISISLAIHVGLVLFDALPNEVQRRHAFGLQPYNVADEVDAMVSHGASNGIGVGASPLLWLWSL